MTSLLDTPPPSTLAADFLEFLRVSFDPAEGGIGPHTDLVLQPQNAAEPVNAHLVVVLARCAHLGEVVSAAARASAPVRVDCERDELLGVLRWLYLEELPEAAAPAVLLRLRALAQEWGVASLDVAASGALSRSLTGELCCELLRETAREEARARLKCRRCEAARAPQWHPVRPAARQRGAPRRL